MNGIDNKIDNDRLKWIEVSFGYSILINSKILLFGATSLTKINLGLVQNS